MEKNRKVGHVCAMGEYSVNCVPWVRVGMCVYFVSSVVFLSGEFRTNVH